MYLGALRDMIVIGTIELQLNRFSEEYHHATYNLAIKRVGHVWLQYHYIYMKIRFSFNY